MDLCKCGCNKYAALGKIYIQGHHMRVNNHRKGKSHKSETIENLRQKSMGNQSALGHEVTEEVREKLRKAHTGRKNSEESKEKNRIASLGNKYGLGYRHTDEAKNKIGNKSRELWQDKEYVQKLGELKKKYYNSPKGKIHREKSRELAYKNLADPNLNFGHKGRRETYPESIFRKFLESMGAIKDQDFFQEYCVWPYRIDFAYIDGRGKRAIEIDGGFHLKPEAIEHDIKRDKYLKSQGWVVFRIPVKDLYKLLEPLWPPRS